MSTPAPSRPLTDSPWWWGYLFGVAALIALFLIAPKYARRQAQLERQFEGRERAWEQKLRPTPPPAAAQERPDPALILPLRPLVVLVGALTIAAWLAFWFSRRGGGRPESSSGGGDTSARQMLD
jgi:hypothetical protein